MLQAFPQHCPLVKRLWFRQQQTGQITGCRTFVASSRLPSLEYGRTRMTQTSEPLRDPSQISPEPPDATGRWPIFRADGERVYEVGSTILVPHIFLSSGRHFREPELGESGI